jgi:hypothetical protein
MDRMSVEGTTSREFLAHDIDNINVVIKQSCEAGTAVIRCIEIVTFNARPRSFYGEFLVAIFINLRFRKRYTTT